MVGRIAIAVVLASARIASANMGAPWSGGQMTGEPGGITDIAIAHEELVIDLRPLASAEGRAHITATYHLDNRGDAKHLELVFVSGSRTVGTFDVKLDGVAVHTESMKTTADLPANWSIPKDTPSLDGNRYGNEYRPDDAVPHELALDVAPGRHDVVVTYAADAVTYRETRNPLVLHQLVYVLSPARTWAGFGGLDATVHVPPGWHIAVTPDLPRSGDTLHGTFATLPADAFAITTQARTGSYELVAWLLKALVVLVVIGGGVLVYVTTRARERRRIAALELRATTAAVFTAFVWSVAFAIAGQAAIFAPPYVLPAAEVNHRGYGDGLFAVLVVMTAMLVFGVGIAIAFIAARVVRGPTPPRPF